MTKLIQRWLQKDVQRNRKTAELLPRWMIIVQLVAFPTFAVQVAWDFAEARSTMARLFRAGLFLLFVIGTTLMAFSLYWKAHLAAVRRGGWSTGAS